MPGLHSPAKLAERRLRAHQRGFLVPKSCVAKTFVQVNSLLAPNVKKIVRSLECHAENEKISGRRFHLARHSSLAAEIVIGEPACKQQLSWHRQGNRAKHSIGLPLFPTPLTRWADLEEDVAEVSSNGGASGSIRDPVFFNDPWREACATVSCETRSHIASIVSMEDDMDAWSGWRARSLWKVSTGGDQQSLPNAGDFVPFAANSLSATPSSLDSALALIESQNATIALLSNELELLKQSSAWHWPPPPSGDDAELTGRLESIETNMEKLNNSVHMIVKDSVNERLPDFAQFASVELVKGHSDDVRSLIGELGESINKDAATLVQNTCSTAVAAACKEALVKMVDKLKLFQGELQALTDSQMRTSERLDELEASNATSRTTQSSVPVSFAATLAPVETNEKAQFHVGDLVTLCGLTASSLNGMSGSIVSYTASSGRFGVKLAASGEMKALKPRNLSAYERNGELCNQCGDELYLTDFPSCGCGSTPKHSNTPDGSCSPQDVVESRLSCFATSSGGHPSKGHQMTQSLHTSAPSESA